MIRRAARAFTARAALGLLLGGGLALGSVLGVVPARADTFATPPDPLPAAAPGTVIRRQAIPAPEGARAWRVLYHSRDLADRDIVVSGTVVAPVGRAPRGRRPILAWAHGTTGLADACAPSVRTSAASEIPWVNEFLAAGYVIVATDYEGIGPPGIHPYLVGESEGRSVLDAARAARDLPIGAGRKVAVYGHSQGGHAALFAGEIADRYAPELKVRGVVAGAPVTDVGRFVDETIGSTTSLGFLVMGGIGYQAAYPDLATDGLLTPTGRARRDVAVFGCLPEVIGEFFGSTATDVFAIDPRTVPAWQTRFRENTPGRRRSRVPVLVLQGTADDLTPESITTTYVEGACAQGSVVEYRRYPDADHLTVIVASRDDVLRFVAARLAGSRTTDGCVRRST